VVVVGGKAWVLKHGTQVVQVVHMEQAGVHTNRAGVVLYLLVRMVRLEVTLLEIHTRVVIHGVHVEQLIPTVEEVVVLVVMELVHISVGHHESLEMVVLVFTFLPSICMLVVVGQVQIANVEVWHMMVVVVNSVLFISQMELTEQGVVVVVLLVVRRSREDTVALELS
jgi:hypothetical protein